MPAAALANQRHRRRVNPTLSSLRWQIASIIVGCDRTKSYFLTGLHGRAVIASALVVHEIIWKPKGRQSHLLIRRRIAHQSLVPGWAADGANPSVSNGVSVQCGMLCMEPVERSKAVSVRGIGGVSSACGTLAGGTVKLHDASAGTRQDKTGLAAPPS